MAACKTATAVDSHRAGDDQQPRLARHSTQAGQDYDLLKEAVIGECPRASAPSSSTCIDEIVVFHVLDAKHIASIPKRVLEGRIGPKDVVPVDFRDGKFAFDRTVH